MDTNEHEEITSYQDHGNTSDKNNNSILARYDPIRLAKYLHKKGTVCMGSSSQFNWRDLGIQAGVCFNSLPPNVSFLYGLLDAKYIPNERKKVKRHKEAHVERPPTISPKVDQSHTAMKSEHIGPYNGMFASNVNNAPFIIPDHMDGCNEDQDISNHDTSSKNSDQSHTAMESEHIGPYNGMFPSNVKNAPFVLPDHVDECNEDQDIANHDTSSNNSMKEDNYIKCNKLTVLPANYMINKSKRRRITRIVKLVNKRMLDMNDHNKCNYEINKSKRRQITRIVKMVNKRKSDMGYALHDGGGFIGPSKPVPGWGHVPIHSEDDIAEEAGEDSDSEDIEDGSLSTQVPHHTSPGDAWGGGGIFGGPGGGDRDGGDGGGQLESLKFPPHDWQNWKVFKKLFHCDFDGFSITGNPRILKPILGEFTQVIIPSYSGRVKPSTANTLLVTIYPFYIFVDEDFKHNIIQELNKIRRITHKPATKDNVLLFKSITMASPQFVRVLQRVGVMSVTVIGYGQKGPVNWGLKLMKAARNADIDCICEYDLAINIPPEKMHWARFDEHNMVPASFDDRANNTLNYVTLVACPRRDGIEDIFGHKVKIFHWPIFTLSQLELNGFESIPIYGGFNVYPSRGGRFHQVPDVQIDDCFDSDDDHPINHHLDWDDNDGESGFDLICNQMTQKCNY